MSVHTNPEIHLLIQCENSASKGRPSAAFEALRTQRRRTDAPMFLGVNTAERN